MAKPKPWRASERVFENATRDSFPKTVDLSTFTEAALAGPIGLPDLHTYYIQYHTTLITAYDKWKSGEGTQKSSSSSLADLFKGLVVAAKDWDLSVQQVYSQGTPEYIALFPNGRKPFYTGTQSSRIRATNTLAISIGADAQLTAVKTSVSGYYTAISNANSTQKGTRTHTGGLSDDVEKARIAVCGALQYVRSGLNQHYINEPWMVTKYFLMDLLQNKKQREYTGRIDPQAIKEILKRSFMETDTFYLENLGPVDLEFYLSNNRNGILPPGAIPLIIPAGTRQHVAASQLGNLANTYLMVRNPSTLVEGDWKMEQ